MVLMVPYVIKTLLLALPLARPSVKLLLTDDHVFDGDAVLLHLGRHKASFRRHPVGIPGNIDEFVAQTITSIFFIIGENTPTKVIIVLLRILSNSKNKAIGKANQIFPIAFINIL